MSLLEITYSTCSAECARVASPVLLFSYQSYTFHTTLFIVRKLKEANIGARLIFILICSLLYADDIVLIAETSPELQILLDIVWDYGKKWHFSFGTNKCQVVLGSFWREPPVEFKFGDHKLEIVNLYRYLGIQETLNGHDYSEFIGAKLKSVRARLAKVRRVGGYIDGLDPFNMRRLYLSQIRPIIEFGATTIPYKNTWLTKLEDMQFECLRQLFGFFPKTKKETTARFANRLCPLPGCLM